MELTRPSLILLASLLTAPTLAQTRTGWQIDYAGHLDTDRQGLWGPEHFEWDKPDFDSPSDDDSYGSMAAPDTRYDSPPGPTAHCETKGTVKVRLKWFGPGNPTSYPNLAVRSVAHGVVYPDPGSSTTASNGFKSVSDPVEATADSFKLIQPGQSGENVTTLSINIVAGDQSQSGTDYYLVATTTTRYALVKAANPTYRKGSQTGSTTKTFTTTDGTVRSWDVPIFERLANDYLTNVSNDHRRADIGLPLASYRDGPTEPTWINLRYEGEYGSDSGSWTMMASLSGTSASSSTSNSSVPYIDPPVDQPCVVTTKSGGKLQVTYLARDSESIDVVNLKVQWPDGMDADASLSAHYYPETKTVRSYDPFGDPDKATPVTQLTSDGQDHVSYQTDGYETGGADGTVGFNLLGATTGGISIALAAWQPEAAIYVVALAAAQKGLDAAGEWGKPDAFTFTRNARPVENPGDMFPGTVPESYDWIGRITPETLYTPHEVEYYDQGGYAKHDLVLQTTVDPTRGKRGILIIGRPHS